MPDYVKVDWGKTVTFGIVAVCVTILIAMGKVSPDKLGLLAMWLVPSPIGVKKDESQ